MGGKHSRQKGKRGEREVANLLKTHGYKARRGVQYSGGEDSPDVVGLPGFHIEVKRTESLSLYAAMEQSINDAGGNIPLVFHRRNGKGWVVVLRAEDFLNVLLDNTTETGYIADGSMYAGSNENENEKEG